MNNGSHAPRVTRAIYPGSFDPPTNGHLDVIERAAGALGELIVAIVVNPQKRDPMFTLTERESMLKECVAHLPNVRVAHFRGLLADYVRAQDLDAIVKGLRVVSDFESEMSTALMNRSLANVETLFLMSDAKYSFVSSSLVKEVFFLGGDVSHFVPAKVLEVMTTKRTALKRS